MNSLEFIKKRADKLAKNKSDRKVLGDLLTLAHLRGSNQSIKNTIRSNTHAMIMMYSLGLVFGHLIDSWEKIIINIVFFTIAYVAITNLINSRRFD